MTLYYQQSGEGQPLIIIHGLFGSADNWRSMAKYYANSYQVICVDLRNHGRSPHSDQNDFAVMAEDIHQLCSSLGINKVNLLGHSLGGKVAMQFAAMYPDLVDKLVIADMTPRAYFSEHTPLMDAMMALDLSSYDSRAKIDEALADSITDKAVRQFLLMNLQSNEQGFYWRINLSALKASYPQMMAPVCEGEALSMPSLFVYGELSDYVTEQDRTAISQQFTQAQFQQIDGAGHWLHAEKPQTFKRVVEAFLKNE